MDLISELLQKAKDALLIAAFFVLIFNHVYQAGAVAFKRYSMIHMVLYILWLYCTYDLCRRQPSKLCFDIRKFLSPLDFPLGLQLLLRKSLVVTRTSFRILD